MTPQDVLGIVKDVAVTFAALVAGTIGILGFWNWRRELVGEKRFGVAKKAMVLASRAWTNAERLRFQMILRRMDDGSDTPSERTTAYLKRQLKPIYRDVRKLEAGIFEMRALWGEKADEPASRFIRAVSQLVNFDDWNSESVVWKSKEYVQQQREALADFLNAEHLLRQDDASYVDVALCKEAFQQLDRAMRKHLR